MTTRGFPIGLGLITLALAATVAADAVDASWLARHYEKRETMVAMRDGTRLFTSILTPRNDSKTYPILLTRTPYGCVPYGPEAMPDVVYPDPLFVEEGVILVCQDVRGTRMSEGQ